MDFVVGLVDSVLHLFTRKVKCFGVKFGENKKIKLRDPDYLTFEAMLDDFGKNDILQANLFQKRIHANNNLQKNIKNCMFIVLKKSMLHGENILYIYTS